MKLIFDDLKRYRVRTGYLGMYRIFTHHSFAITFWFRLVQFFSKYRILTPLKFICELILSVSRLLTGIQLPSTTKVGGGIFFIHYSDIVINALSTIGDNVTIFNGVTIGANEQKEGAPIIGNNVVIATGAKIIGPISIGNNVYIGANAVVVHDIPDNCVVAGIPAKIVNRAGKKYVAPYNCIL